jgi:hypothetical protein
MKKIEESYISHRRWLGILGTALPFIVLFFGRFGENDPEWYYSISAAFYTNAAPAFTAIMGAVGVFLITYNPGYGKLDRVINILTGVFALLIAFFPRGATELSRVGLLHIPVKVSAIIHNISAAIFFLLLAFNNLFLFTKGGDNPTKEKLVRNIIYRIGGIGILGFMAIQIIITITKPEGPYTTVNEAGMLLCFGAAWLIKGETILKDNPALPVDRL